MYGFSFGVFVVFLVCKLCSVLQRIYVYSYFGSLLTATVHVRPINMTENSINLLCCNYGYHNAMIVTQHHVTASCSVKVANSLVLPGTSRISAYFSQVPACAYLRCKMSHISAMVMYICNIWRPKIQ